MSQSTGHLDKMKEKNFVPGGWSDTIAGAQKGWQLRTLGEVKNSTSPWASCCDWTCSEQEVG